MRRSILLTALLVGFLAPATAQSRTLPATAQTTTSPATAQTRTFTIDVPSSKVEFALGDVLHTVRGTFLLKSGTVSFDDSGHASGQIVVDAASGDSGSKARDRKMKREVLETDRFPDIILRVQRIEGIVPRDGKSNVQLSGTLSLHGDNHAVTLSVPLTIRGTSATADVAFPVPYVKWGLKNPSTLFLRVSDTVNIVVHAAGQISSLPHPVRNEAHASGWFPARRRPS